ncbi:hypothetical protein DFH06DRAFT_1128362 [Mycena polygramma]|nr:hypothetical protein DFH06DRAFT_1128362 [Mycena polygramma]
MARPLPLPPCTFDGTSGGYLYPWGTLAIMEAFSHFVYEQSGGDYVYHHFRYAWAELKDGPNPCIIYFKTSSAVGGSCHNDGGRLGIADFKIRHECAALCKRLGLTPIA